ncbi:MAG: hypothetical protein A2V66_17850 [Ignavibacteria bacterium RBG_13_36_8]|nr:MAG: hypothetical protein A2V66_17850 [Ignavibacteria bacterium RBG_13_36_8]
MVRFNSVLFFLFIFLVSINAQNLDSLFHAFIDVRTDVRNIKWPVISGSVSSSKCGFALVNEVKRNFERFSQDQQRILATLLQRPTTDTSIVSPGGFFRIHYDFSGPHTPGYDIEELSLSLDTAYNFEVNYLGYPPPPNDVNEGGDNLYDVYIQSLSRGEYGSTYPAQAIGNNRNTSYMVIDNDFRNYFSEGIKGAKVTVAHELHHAIQIGNYVSPFEDSNGFNDIFYYEITSTSMEEFVFDDVNDYYAYMSKYFDNPEKTFSTRNSSLDGYDLAIWNVFIKDRFGYDIIKRCWELIIEYRALTAIAQSIEEYGSSIKEELNNFGVWTYFTANRAKQGEYFEEAANYPLIKPSGVYDFTPPRSNTIMINSSPVSNNFLVYVKSSNGLNDTLVSIITNADVSHGLGSPFTSLGFEYTLLSNQESSATKINNDYYSLINCISIDLLKETNILNNEPVERQTSGESEYAFPQPFNYTNPNYNFICIPAIENVDGTAELNVYSISMNLVYSSTKNVIGGIKSFIKWNGLDNQNQKLSTGIYIYVTKSGSTIKKGKVVIYNE